MGSLHSFRRTRLRVPSKTPSVTRPHRTSVGAPPNSRSHQRLAGKTGGGKGTGPFLSRLLQPTLPCSKEERHLETSHRSQSSERLLERPDVQDGNDSPHKELHPTRTLGGVIGPVRCILSCSNTPQPQEIPALCLQRPGFPVPGDAFWAGHSSQSLHEAHGSCRLTSQSQRCSSPAVLRRLATSSAQSSSTVGQPGLFMERTTFPRPTSQQREVGTYTFTRLCLCRNEFPNAPEQGQNFSSENLRPQRSSELGHKAKKAHSSGLSIPDRHPELCSRLCRTGSAVSQTNSVLPVRPVEMVSRQYSCLDTHSPTPCSTPPMVAQRGDSLSGSTTPTTDTIHSAHLRCKLERLGSSPGTSGSDRIRSLVSTGVQTSHQQSRNESCQTGNISLQDTGSESLYHAVNRQHDSGILHTSPRRHSVEISRSGNERPPPALPEPGSSPPSQTHSGSTECFGRQVVPEQSTTPFRVDSSSGSSQPDFPQTGTSNGRSVCDSSQQQTSSIRQPGLRPSSLGSRRAFVRLGPTGGLRLSPTDSHSASSEQNQGVQLQGTSNSALVAQEPMVQRPAQSASRSSKKSTKQARPTLTERGTSHEPRHVPSTRLAVIQQSLRKKRFSSKASSLIASARRQSTRAVYDARWRVYAEWCVREQVNPTDPSPRRIADFLIFLFETKNLSLSSIKGYRSMLSHTLAFHKAAQACADPAISELIRALELKRPVSRSLTPKWDLACVLWSLTKAPYEPLDQASLQFLTWKTVFLLTMASAKRRSEIHALSIEDGHLRFNSSDGSVTLLVQPGFLSKTQLPTIASEPFSIPSLSQACGTQDEDRLLCPIRALKFYLNRVKPLRASRKRLFIPIKGGGDVSAASISRWIASTIRKAYSSLTERDLSFYRIRPHELRALSTSWAYVNHAPLADVLSAAFWRNSTTFSSFYLRSFGNQQGNLSLLGPLVVAQSVVHSSDGQDGRGHARPTSS